MTNQVPYDKIFGYSVEAIGILNKTDSGGALEKLANASAEGARRLRVESLRQKDKALDVFISAIVFMPPKLSGAFIIFFFQEEFIWNSSQR